MAKAAHAVPMVVAESAAAIVGRLDQRMAELISPTDTMVDVTIPYDRGDLVNRVHADGRVDATEQDLAHVAAPDQAHDCAGGREHAAPVGELHVDALFFQRLKSLEAGRA